MTAATIAPAVGGIDVPTTGVGDTDHDKTDLNRPYGSGTNRSKNALGQRRFPGMKYRRGADVQSPARATKAHALSLAHLPRAPLRSLQSCMSAPNLATRLVMLPRGASIGIGGAASPQSPDEFTGTRTRSDQFESHAPTGSPRIEECTKRGPECLVQYPNAFEACRTVMACMGDRP
jgi:hypothetical protein